MLANKKGFNDSNVFVIFTSKTGKFLINGLVCIKSKLYNAIK